MEHTATQQHAVVAVFARHQDAEEEQAVKTDGFLVVAHGSADEMARSKAILEASHPSRVDVRENVRSQASDAVQTAAVSGVTASIR